MNKSKRIAAALLTAVLAVSLAACNSNNEAQTPANNQGQETNGDEGNTNTGVTEPAAPEAEGSTLTAVGSYTGQMDTTSIEVILPEGPTAFQFGDSFDPAVLEQLQENDAVEVEYTEKSTDGVKQRFVTKLTKVAAAEQGGGESGSRPATQDFEMELEGMKETRTAKLAEGNGYSLYVFDMFTFDAAANKLYMTAFPDYSVEIVPLAPDYTLEDVHKEAVETLASTGEVHELKGEEITANMRDAKLFLLASTEKVTKEVIVKEIDGAAYQFNVNIPVGEANDGFGTHAFLSLNSIASN
ncbi:hypothetical protein FHS18_004673 [Paenibacillus phyllosphaerae]|uniref:Uncharacterized protein n=1 Tax=Paenibacillus phyllosphaerae TaxID=274593 RepID=A0A7W5FPU7_9BACL|nr:hypothetical protein [Paenibacillus phyllosphaerae]MBB3112572.1 hypothetical protein [Paenibacillus phyllosphaerae]